MNSVITKSPSFSSVIKRMEAGEERYFPADSERYISSLISGPVIGKHENFKDRIYTKWMTQNEEGVTVCMVKRLK